MKWLIAAAILAPALAAAQDRHLDNAQLYPHMKGVEYFCTDARGARLELGQVVCITASCTTWMARCEMAANNNMAMWRKVQDGCPAAGLADRFRRAARG